MNKLAKLQLNFKKQKEQKELDASKEPFKYQSSKYFIYI